jgi:hypothetical protein
VLKNKLINYYQNSEISHETFINSISPELLNMKLSTIIENIEMEYLQSPRKCIIII